MPIYTYYIILLIEKPFFTCYFLYGFYVLRHFQDAKELTGLIPYGKVADIHVFVAPVDPKILMVLFAGSQVFYNFLNYVYAGRGMAIFYASADDSLGPGKYPVLAL